MECHALTGDSFTAQGSHCLKGDGVTYSIFIALAPINSFLIHTLLSEYYTAFLTLFTECSEVLFQNIVQGYIHVLNDHFYF